MKASSKHIDQLIEEYLLSKMDEAEREAFEKRLSKDLILRERMNDHIRNGGLPLEVPENDLPHDLDGFLEEEASANRSLYLQAVVSILIAAGLIFTLSLFEPGKSNSELVSTYFNPLPSSMVKMPTNSLAVQGLDAYDRADYPRAIHYFNQLDSTETSIFDLYSGIGHLALHQYDQAKTSFLMFEEIAPSELENTVKWYLALAALGQDKEDKAVQYLQELLSDTTAINEQAELLLNEIK